MLHRFPCRLFSQLRRLCGLLVAAVVGVGSLVAPAAAYTPDSPEVKQAVERAATFLAGSSDRRLGAKALAGRVMVYLGRSDHERVQDAVAAIRHDLEAPGGDEESRIYSLGLEIAFLSELDPQRYRSELAQLVALLIERQKSHGGWGYPGRATGDTSMTQYAVYGLWNAAQAGIEIDRTVWARAVEWLIRTQDPGGGWGYQGNDPGNGPLTAQSEIRRSMTEAALASLYLGGERFGLWKFKRDEPQLSKLLRPIGKKSTAPSPPPFDTARYRTALDGGNRWDQASREPIYAPFPCYHLYTIERYHSFREAALNTRDAAAWYDVGVDYLLPAQQADGSWSTGEGQTAATAFAALFLMRTTRTAIQKIDTLGAGTLIGGRGLPLGPKPAAGAPAAPAAPGTPARADADLAALTERLQDPAFLAVIAGAESVGPAADAPPPSELKQRLLTLARGDSPEAQAAALAALGRTGDLDHVPLLIEMLGDADPRVHQAAVDALRFIARRSDEFGKPLPADAAARSAEATRWQEWYRTIRPPGR